MRARALNDDEIRVLRVLCASKKPLYYADIAGPRKHVKYLYLKNLVDEWFPEDEDEDSDIAAGYIATIAGRVLLKTLDAQATKNPVGQEVFDEVRKELNEKPRDNAPLEFDGQARP